jgi:hypothetical protein
MSDVVHEPMGPVNRPESEVDGPLQATGLGRRAVLQSLASGVGLAVLATPAVAHEHQAPAAGGAKPAPPAPAARAGAAPALVFFDKHAFDTLAVLSDQIVPGSRAAKVPEFLDRLLDVEGQDTRKRCMQAIGAFEQQARAAHGVAWKALAPAQATALLTKMSQAPENDPARRAFEFVKGGVSEIYYLTQAGMKELGWNGSVMFASPIACG